MALDPTLTVRNELARLLTSHLADQGTTCDTGGGLGSADIWVTIGGVEFYIELRKSNNQLAKEQSE